MKIIRYAVGFVILSIAISVGCFFYLWNQSQYGKNNLTQPAKYELKKGDDAWKIGAELEEMEIVQKKAYFVFYLWKSGKSKELKAGNYTVAPGSTIPEIVRVFTEGEKESGQVKVTFPEGWESKDMAKRLSANGLPGDEFLKIVKEPSQDTIAKYGFLSDLPKKSSLEGYLFPDTYFFSKDATAQEILDGMLKNFGRKYSTAMQGQTIQSGKTVHQILTMASIIEGEVPTQADRKIVSGIFWKRIEIGQPLQSCATLAYILGEYKAQYSIEETQVESPYNTYRNKGLPPGPINNPGSSAITASITPQDTGYLYFLSSKNKETIFSKTFEEHVANKQKYGL